MLGGRRKDGSSDFVPILSLDRLFRSYKQGINLNQRIQEEGNDDDDDDDEFEIEESIENIRPMKKGCGYSIKVNFQIKPARKPIVFYQPNLSPQSYSFPYKYDIQIYIKNVKKPSSHFSSNNNNNNKWKPIFKLYVCKTEEYIQFNKRKEKTIQIESTTLTEYSKKEYSYSFRLYFNVCSFHCKKSEFILKCYLIQEDMKSLLRSMPLLVFNSIPFLLNARKMDKHDSVCSIKHKSNEIFTFSSFSGDGEEGFDDGDDAEEGFDYDYDEDGVDEKEKANNQNSVHLQSVLNLILLSPIRCNLENLHDQQFTTRKRKRLPSFSSLFPKKTKRKI